MSTFCEHLHTRWRIGALVLLVGAFLAVGIASSGESTNAAFPEIARAAELPADFAVVSDFFQELAQEKGGAYAFEVLKRADLPPNTDLHLLGHVVGDELYKQEKIDGIQVCTHDFRNACSHTIVVGALLEYGEGALPDIRDVCYQAPGGKGAYTMCFHGLGHGVLAYVGYELPEAVKLCKKLGTAAYQYREYTECVGGTIMEMTSGVHDPATWERKKDEYFRDDDPLYPCTADFMPADAKNMCYTYLTPHLILSSGGNLGNPDEDDFAPAFRACDGAPTEEEKRVCWGSFGKEFVVLAQNRDIRKIEAMTNKQLNQVFEWCLLAGVSRGTSACVISAVQSLYWGGENDRGVAVRFCSVIPDDAYRTTCVDELINAVGFYIDDAAYYRAFCNELPKNFVQECHATLDV